ncbi:hypothetical protein ACMB93_005392, partial [Escherichia coli]
HRITKFTLKKGGYQPAIKLISANDYTQQCCYSQPEAHGRRNLTTSLQRERVFAVRFRVAPWLFRVISVQ